ncbi:hypothetical protein SynMEDNS5_01946 [Synechococcus sp. MEDNS5]|nr:hypothetical protein SynMEDNS5_01946 [Synechococcus sp. MEDNS5]
MQRLALDAIAECEKGFNSLALANTIFCQVMLMIDLSVFD